MGIKIEPVDIALLEYHFKDDIVISNDAWDNSAFLNITKDKGKYYFKIRDNEIEPRSEEYRIDFGDDESFFRSIDHMTKTYHVISDIMFEIQSLIDMPQEEKNEIFNKIIMPKLKNMNVDKVIYLLSQKGGGE